MTRRTSRRAPIVLPRHSRPTLVGSGNTPSSAKLRAVGRRPAAQVGFCCVRPFSRRLRGGSPHAPVELRSRPRRPKPLSPRAGVGQREGATSSPAALPPGLSLRWRSPVSPTGSAELPSSSNGSQTSRGNWPNSSASAPKRHSRQRRKRPIVSCSTWRSGSATRREFQPSSSRTFSIGRARCKSNLSTPGKRRRSSSAARPPHSMKPPRRC